MLQEQIELLFAHVPDSFGQQHFALFQSFKDALNSGQVRAAEPDASKPAGWRVNPWIKKGILLGFRMGAIVDMSIDPAKQPFFDKATYPVKRIAKDAGVRIVPGGSSIRDGCFIGTGVTCMPPTFVNVGAYVDDYTMVDSHALVGSCAQLGKRCHISAAAQIGGVLEPVGAMPVIIEDDVLIGGNCGVFEGTPVYDIVRGEIYRASENQPLVIPEKAVVVAGSRPISSGQGKDWGLSLYAPVIVKYRDAKTDLRAQLEDLLR
jgi:2,3,4,5-tetrahydropyridine-2-carboxylate N-succinyltransferase